MKLLWLSYKARPPRYVLFLEFAHNDHHIVGLDTSKVNDKDRKKIMSDGRFDKLSLDDKVRWMREHCPITLKNAYRTLTVGKCTILNTYDVKEHHDR